MEVHIPHAGSLGVNVEYQSQGHHMQVIVKKITTAGKQMRRHLGRAAGRTSPADLFHPDLMTVVAGFCPGVDCLALSTASFSTDRTLAVHFRTRLRNEFSDVWRFIGAEAVARRSGRPRAAWCRLQRSRLGRPHSRWRVKAGDNLYAGSALRLHVTVGDRGWRGLLLPHLTTPDRSITSLEYSMPLDAEAPALPVLRNGMDIDGVIATAGLVSSRPTGMQHIVCASHPGDGLRLMGGPAFYTRAVPPSVLLAAVGGFQLVGAPFQFPSVYADCRGLCNVMLYTTVLIVAEDGLSAQRLEVSAAGAVSGAPGTPLTCCVFVSACSLPIVHEPRPADRVTRMVPLDALVWIIFHGLGASDF